LKIFYVFWTMFFLVGITQNYKGYSLVDWMVLLIVFFFPLIFKKLKEKNMIFKGITSFFSLGMAFVVWDMKESFFTSIEGSIIGLVLIFFPMIIFYISSSVKNKRKNKVPSLKKKVKKQESSIPLKKENKNLTSSDKIITDEEVKEHIKRDYQKRLQQVNRVLNKNTDIYPPNTEKYILSSEEKIFLDKFLNQILENKIDLRIRTERRSNGEIFVEYRGCQVGRINLQDGNHSMQILCGMYGNKVIGGNLNNFIEEIPAWIRYIKYLKRNWNK
jgi:hypothetical protein